MFRQTWPPWFAPHVQVDANAPAIRHFPSLVFPRSRPADDEEKTFQDWREEPSQAVVVTLLLPAGRRQRPAAACGGR